MRLEKVLGIPVGAETVFMTMTMLMLTCMLVAGTGAGQYVHQRVNWCSFKVVGPEASPVHQCRPI